MDFFRVIELDPVEHIEKLAKCERKFCKEVAEEPHPCPYKEDIEGDGFTLCNCCNSCAYNCLMDI